MGEVSARRRITLVALGWLLAAGCSTPTHDRGAAGAAAMTKVVLSTELEAELAAIRRDPLDAVGFGEKAFLPYELRKGEGLVRSRDAVVTARLASEASDTTNDRVFRLVMLQVMAYRDDPAVDPALAGAVGDPVIGGLASYLVGRIGFKGYPARARVAAPLLRALAPHLDDAATFDDPWYQKRYRVGDLALGAFVRIAGPDRFRFTDPQDATYVGYTVLPPSDALRSTLLAQARAFVITD